MTHRKNRVALAVLVVVLVVGSACASKNKTTTSATTVAPATSSSTTTAASTDLTIKVGNIDESNLGVDFLAFYPTSLQAAQGDTIRFQNPTKGTPHTVTFGVAPDHSNQPALISKGAFAPISAGPCISTTPVKAGDDGFVTTCFPRTRRRQRGHRPRRRPRRHRRRPRAAAHHRPPRPRVAARHRRRPRAAAHHRRPRPPWPAPRRPRKSR